LLNSPNRDDTDDDKMVMMICAQVSVESSTASGHLIWKVSYLISPTVALVYPYILTRSSRDRRRLSLLQFSAFTYREELSL